MVGGATILWYNRNVQTYSCTSGDFVWTSTNVAHGKCYMNYWHSDLHDSVCQMDGISEIVRKFILLWSTVSYVHQEHLMEDITIHHGQYSDWPFVLNDHDNRQPVRIICGNRGQYWLRFHSYSLQEAPLTCSVRQFNILYLAEDSPGLHLLNLIF